MKAHKALFILAWLFASFTVMAKTAGYIEYIKIEKNIIMPAKLDTGAKSASIGVENLKIYRSKSGKSMVSFAIENKGKLYIFEKPLVKYARIKMRSGENGKKYVKRPVVKLEITFDNESKEILVNLTNRDNFNYPVLLGRNALKIYNIQVNPAKLYTLKRP